MRHRCTCLISFFAACVAAASSTATLAATFTVDLLADDADALQCTGAPLDCSLRGAVRAGNLTPGGPHTIMVPGDTFLLSLLGANEDAALTGDLDVDGDVIIQGAGSELTIIKMQTGNIDRVFDVRSGSVEFRGLTIWDGSSVVDNGGGIRQLAQSLTLVDVQVVFNRAQERGGGVYCASGSLVIEDSVITGNSAENQRGGGIYAASCAVTISGSLIEINRAGSNRAVGEGGAIYFDSFGAGFASLQVTNTIMSGNSASLNGGAIFIADGTGEVTGSTIRRSAAGDGGSTCSNPTIGRGGAIYIAANGSLTLTDTTLSDNCAGAFGGGADVLGSLTLDSSTVRCNSAPTASGGLGLGDGSVASITNSTISQNSSDIGAGINAVLADLTLTNTTIADQLGDGLAMVTTFGTVEVANSVFGDPCAQLPSSTIISGGGNVEPLGQTCVDSPVGTDQSVADLGLGPLGDFGGATQTHLPLPGSPLVGAAVEISCPATDQRGIARSDCDSGSVERQPSDLAPIFTGDFECMGAELWSSTSP